MVIIGGMRSLLGPALGALFYILFREYLSIWTPNWLLFFGLLFVGFVVFSPTGLVGVWRRDRVRCAPRWSRRRRWRGAGSSRGADARIPVRGRKRCGTSARQRRGSPRSSAASTRSRRRASRWRTLVARADRSQRRGQDDRLQSHLRPVPAGRRRASCDGSGAHRESRRSRSSPRGLRARSRSRTCSRAPGRGKPAARRAGARRQPFRRLEARRAIPCVTGKTPSSSVSSGSPASNARRPGHCRTAGSGCSTWDWRWPRRRGSSCSTSRWRDSPRRSASA